MDILMREQQDILEIVDRIREEHRGKGLEWNRFRGDATARVVQNHMQEHLPSDVSLADCAWVQDCGIEFDILIVDHDAEPVGYTKAFPKNNVRLLVEVKTSGVFYKKDEVKDRFIKWKDRIRRETGKTILYISMWERQNLYERTVEGIGKEDTFILKVDKEVNQGEWRRFIERVKSLL